MTDLGMGIHALRRRRTFSADLLISNKSLKLLFQTVNNDRLHENK